MVSDETLNEWIQELEREDSTSIKTIKDLTVSEFKSLIREVISEEIAKHSFVQPVPMQPYYYQPLQPWESNKVWCSTDISNVQNIHKEEI